MLSGDVHRGDYVKYLVYDKIDELLKQKGMSRRKLAMQAGISTSNMSALFARRPVPLADKYLNPIAAALGVDRSAFDNEVLEREYEERLQEEYELAFESQQVNSIFNRLGSREQRAERARRFYHPSEQLRGIMDQIEALDDVDLDVLEQWVSSYQFYRMFSRVKRDRQKLDDEQSAKP